MLTGEAYSAWLDERWEAVEKLTHELPICKRLRQEPVTSGILRGCALVHAGLHDWDLLLQSEDCDVLAYWNYQRRLVGKRGDCGQCWRGELTREGNCMRTNRPCPRFALSDIVEAYGVINQGNTDERDPTRVAG